MAILVGSNSQSGTQVGYEEQVSYSNYTAVATGTGATIYAYLDDTYSNDSVRLCIWDNNGDLLDSVEVTSWSTGWVSGSISASITNGVEYALGIMSDSYENYGYNSSDTGFCHYSSAYASGAPDPLGTTCNWDSLNGALAMYVESGAAGLAIPVAMHHYRQMND